MLTEKELENVSDSIAFLAERVAALTQLADPSAPSVNFANAIPRGVGGRRQARSLMFDVARGFARRVPLTKLAYLDGDVRPFLASLIVSAMHRAGETLVIPKDMDLEQVTLE